MRYETAEEVVVKELGTFSNNETISDWTRKNYVHMAVALTKQAFPHEDEVTTQVEDFVHGLTHVFYYGIMEGMMAEQEEKGNTDEG